MERWSLIVIWWMLIIFWIGLNKFDNYIHSFQFYLPNVHCQNNRRVYIIICYSLWLWTIVEVMILWNRNEYWCHINCSILRRVVNVPYDQNNLRLDDSYWRTLILSDESFLTYSTFPNFLLFPLVRTMYSFIVSYNAPVSFESADNFTSLPFKYQSKFQVGISEYLLLLA